MRRRAVRAGVALLATAWPMIAEACSIWIIQPRSLDERCEWHRDMMRGLARAAYAEVTDIRYTEPQAGDEGVYAVADLRILKSIKGVFPDGRFSYDVADIPSDGATCSVDTIPTKGERLVILVAKPGSSGGEPLTEAMSVKDFEGDARSCYALGR